jgi:uncharacterized membrane protein YhaH (DUF805 family)
MDFIKSSVDTYVSVLKQYTQFEGRARRSEFWKFTLVSIVIALVLDQVANILGTLYGLAVLVPSLAVGARRLHDIGKSGWWLLIGLIPFVGGIILIVLTCLDSEAGSNKYGPNPKGNNPTGGSTLNPTPTPAATV